MLNDFRLALSVLREPAAARALLLSLLLSTLLFALLAFASSKLLIYSQLIPWQEWNSFVGNGFALVMALFLGWLLFPVVFSATASLFTDRLAAAIERRHYPDLPPARHIGFAEQLGLSLKIARKSFTSNLFALPLYLIPGVNLLAFVLVNASPMAFDYFTSAALRRHDLATCQQMFAANARSLRRTGAFIALLFILPVLNLVAPLLATALMTHHLARQA